MISAAGPGIDPGELRIRTELLRHRAIKCAMRAGHNGLTTIPARPVLSAPSSDTFLASAVVVNDPTNRNAIPVNITEQDILKTYPWDYQMLTDKLKSRYLDFIANAKYHENRKRITLTNAKLKMTRYLDPVKEQRSAKRVLQSKHHCRVRQGLHPQEVTDQKS
jgi:hypothetical protein